MKKEWHILSMIESTFEENNNQKRRQTSSTSFIISEPNYFPPSSHNQLNSVIFSEFITSAYDAYSMVVIFNSYFNEAEWENRTNSI